MTVAHHAEALRAPSLTAALCALRARGLRVSTARRLVLQALYEAEGPLSAETLAARVPGSDLASLHRNLDVLEALGLVRHVHVGHGAGRYSLALNDVEFVACERCGAFEALASHRLHAAREAIERECGLVARFTHFPIVGVCSSCQSGPLET